MVLDGLRKIELVISALSSGILQPDTWAHDHILGHGLAGQKNRLGSAMVHLLAHSNPENRRLVVFMLAGELEKGGICRGRDSVDVASDAIAWIENPRCEHCHGNGVMNFQQVQCPVCMGLHERPKPHHEPTRKAIGVMVERLHSLELRLRKLLRKGPIDKHDKIEVGIV